MMKYKTRLLGAGMLLVGIAGCGLSDDDLEVIDLNRVLDIMVVILDRPAELRADVGEADRFLAERSLRLRNSAAKSAPAGEAELKPTEATAEDKAKQDAFLKQFADELNRANLIKSQVGVQLNGDGSIEGFTDPNRNSRKDANEKMLFTVQIDEERSRLIASDGQNLRPATYRPPQFGFFSGYLFGSMLGRQNSFFSGRSKPTFGSMQMSPSNYHASAVSQARTRVRSSGVSSSGGSSSGGSVRSRSGSGGFSVGK